MEYSLWNLPPGLWQTSQGTIPIENVPRPTYYASATLPVLSSVMDVSDGDLTHFGDNSPCYRSPAEFLSNRNILAGRSPVDKAQLEGMLQMGNELMEPRSMESGSNDSTQMPMASPSLIEQRRQKRRGSDSYDHHPDDSSQQLVDYARQQSFQHPMYGMLLSQISTCKQEDSALSDEEDVKASRVPASGPDFLDDTDPITDRSADSPSAKFECGDCGLVADTPDALKKHTAQAHSEPATAVCPVATCQFRTSNQSEMESHVTRHVADSMSPTSKNSKPCPIGLQRVRYEREEYRCQICSYSCTIEKAYHKHLKIHSMGVPAPIKYSCVICGKDRPSEVEMNKHMKKHRDDRYFCCDICIFKTVQLKKLVQHRRMHTGEKPHLCPHCSYRSARRDNLRSHVRRVHKKENLYCDTFSPRSVLLSARPTALTQDGLSSGDASASKHTSSTN